MKARAQGLSARSHPIRFLSTTTAPLVVAHVMSAHTFKLQANSLSFLRLDGSLQPQKRQERVDNFNSDPSVFAFLLSSKAGGCAAPLTLCTPQP